MAASYYPMDEEDDSTRVPSTVRLSERDHERIQFMADLWNALDASRDLNRAKKWKASSVIERLVQVGLDGFGAQIGGWPESRDERAAMLRRAGEVVNRLKK